VVVWAERVLQESLAALEKENEEIAQANEALKRMVRCFAQSLFFRLAF
jgi:hypothetical protein